MEIKINLHVSADASVTAALMAIAAAMSNNQVTALPATTMKTVPASEPIVTNPEPADTVQNEQQEPQQEITTRDVFGMNEAELSKLPTGLLMDAIREHTEVNPDSLPGKNTNAKLRKIILDHVTETQEDGGTTTSYVPGPEPTAPQMATTTSGVQQVPAREDFRAAMIPRLQSTVPGVKAAAINAIRATGYDSIDKLFAEGTDQDKIDALAAVLKIKV